MISAFLRLAVLGTATALLAGCHNFTEEKIKGTYPIAEIKLVRDYGNLVEVWVHVASGVKLNSLVDKSYFENLTADMSIEDAKRRLGEPLSVRGEPHMNVRVHIYRVISGEIGFMDVPSEGGISHQVWAYPSNESPSAVIINKSFHDQLLPHLQTSGIVRVNVLRDIGNGGVTLGMNSNRVEYLVLGKKDGE